MSLTTVSTVTTVADVLQHPQSHEKRNKTAQPSKNLWHYPGLEPSMHIHDSRDLTLTQYKARVYSLY
jgi:hypothetical protein